MADGNNPNQAPQHTRRSSFAGQTFADLFSGGRRAENGQPQPGPITTAAAQAQQRRLSIATLGLSGSPNSTSTFGSLRGRRESISSAGGSIDESAIEDEPAGAREIQGSNPTTPFARRMSFGARAMRDIRTNAGGGTSGPGSPGQNGRSPPTTTTGHARAPSSSTNTGTISARDAKGRGEGFNWSDNLRTRAERGSIAAPGGSMPAAQAPASTHTRAKSVATMEPPVQQAPRPLARKPDHFQERILKGDFYMD